MRRGQFFCFLCVFQSIAFAQSAKASDISNGQKAWSAFTCFEYASLAKKGPETERLFNVGLEAGRKFLADVKAGKFSKNEMNGSVPMGILWSISGPSVDFALGRIFEAATQAAYEKVTEQDARGLPLPADQFVMDAQEQEFIASQKYQDGNCGLL